MTQERELQSCRLVDTGGPDKEGLDAMKLQCVGLG